MKYITILFFIHFFSNCYSQNIRGKIVDEKGNNIKNAQILFKEYQNLDLIKEFAFSNDGWFSKDLKNNYTKLVVEIKSFGYNTQFYTIDSLQKTKIYNLNFTLIKDKTITLDEVFIKTKKKPYQIKKDTVEFLVSEYNRENAKK